MASPISLDLVRGGVMPALEISSDRDAVARGGGGAPGGLGREVDDALGGLLGAGLERLAGGGSLGGGRVAGLLDEGDRLDGERALRGQEALGEVEHGDRGGLRVDRARTLRDDGVGVGLEGTGEALGGVGRDLLAPTGERDVLVGVDSGGHDSSLRGVSCGCSLSYAAVITMSSVYVSGVVRRTEHVRWPDTGGRGRMSVAGWNQQGGISRVESPAPPGRG